MPRKYKKALILILLAFACAAPDGRAEFDPRAQLEYCHAQARATIATLPADPTLIPNHILCGQTQWGYTRPGSWTSGFWPGTLWMLYEATADTTLLSAA